MPKDYSPAVVRVAPHAIPAVREAVNKTVDELSQHLVLMAKDGLLSEPWLGDSESARVAQFYNASVMLADDGPFEALRKFSRQLVAAAEALRDAEEFYRRTEGEESARWGMH